jgi:hypothetical protein
VCEVRVRERAILSVFTDVKKVADSIERLLVGRVFMSCLQVVVVWQECPWRSVWLYTTYAVVAWNGKVNQRNSQSGVRDGFDPEGTLARHLSRGWQMRCPASVAPGSRVWKFWWKSLPATRSILRTSDVLSAAVLAGELKIVAGVYDIESGKFSLLTGAM